MTEACCDENGLNCEDGHDVPSTCPVGCAVVFPAFLETCREHVRAEAQLDQEEFEQFEQDCLEQDGLGLVEYAMTLRDSGCVLLFEVKAGGSPGGGHRRLQGGGVFGQRIGVSQPTCEWDELDDLADELDLVCCGADNSLCPAAQGSPQFPASCSPLCAVAMHSFTAACGPSLEAIFGEGGFAAGIAAFEETCLATADTRVFLNAIMNADCSGQPGKECTETLPGLSIDT